MFKKPLLVALLLSVSVSLFANDGYGEDNRQDDYRFNGDMPYDKSKLSQPKIVQQNRFELNLNEKEVYDIHTKVQKKQDILDGVAGINILQSPMFKPLKTVSTIYLHPNFITTLIFPDNLKIAGKPRIAFLAKVFEFDNNTMRIRPDRSSTSGNIVLTLTDGQRNYSLTIFHKRYIPDLECTKDPQSDCKNTHLATVIKFIKAKKFNPFNIIEEYQTLHNISRIVIKKNLDYLTFSKGSETYYIIRDDEFGTIYKDGLSLKVKTTI
jgi:hypothetical protein